MQWNRHYCVLQWLHYGPQRCTLSTSGSQTSPLSWKHPHLVRRWAVSAAAAGSYQAPLTWQCRRLALKTTDSVASSWWSVWWCSVRARGLSSVWWLYDIGDVPTQWCVHCGQSAYIHTDTVTSHCCCCCWAVPLTAIHRLHTIAPQLQPYSTSLINNAHISCIKTINYYWLFLPRVSSMQSAKFISVCWMPVYCNASKRRQSFPTIPWSHRSCFTALHTVAKF